MEYFTFPWYSSKVEWTLKNFENRLAEHTRFIGCVNLVFIIVGNFVYNGFVTESEFMIVG